MNTCIQNFITLLKNMNENSEILSLNNNDFTTQIKKIIDMQYQKNIEGLIENLSNLAKCSNFSIQHPFIPSVVSYAVHNTNQRMANFVLMIDEDNEHPWIIGQCLGLVDIIITKDGIFKTSPYNHLPILSNINILSKLDEDDFMFRKMKFSFLLSIFRPAHYFYDHLKYLYEVERKVGVANLKIKTDKPFYVPSGFNIDNNTAGIYPSVVPTNLVLFENETKRLNTQLEKNIYDEVIKNQKTSVEKKNGALKLWFGITGQKRSWIEQIDSCVNIVKKLSEIVEIELVIDGWTSRIDEVNKSNSEDENVFNEIKSKLSGICTVESTIGKTYEEKILICDICDVFIANAGGGCIVPFRFCSKNGVLHYNTTVRPFHYFPGNYPNTIKHSEKKYTLDKPTLGNSRSDFISYSIPWKHIYNLLASILNETTLQTFEIFSEKEISFELDCVVIKNIESSNPFLAINHKMKKWNGAADILRDVAIAFEKSGRIKEAYEIMKQAHAIRPKGGWIMKKLEKYEKVLKK